MWRRQVERVTTGEPVAVPAEPNRDVLEQYPLRVQERVHEATLAAES